MRPSSFPPSRQARGRRLRDSRPPRRRGPRTRARPALRPQTPPPLAPSRLAGPGRQKEGSAGHGAAAHTQKRPRARWLASPARALTHLQVSVRLSIGTRATGPAGAGRPGLDGAGRRGGEGRQLHGRRPGRWSRWSGKGTPPAGRAAGDGGGAVGGGERGRQPSSATGARRSVRPGLRAPGLERGGGAARGGAGEGRGGGSDPGWSRHRKRSAGDGTYRKCAATPAEGARPAALAALRWRGPTSCHRHARH